MLRNKKVSKLILTLLLTENNQTHSTTITPVPTHVQSRNHLLYLFSFHLSTKSTLSLFDIIDSVTCGSSLQSSRGGDEYILVSDKSVVAVLCYSNKHVTVQPLPC